MKMDDELILYVDEKAIATINLWDLIALRNILEPRTFYEDGAAALECGRFKIATPNRQNP